MSAFATTTLRAAVEILEAEEAKFQATKDRRQLARLDALLQEAELANLHDVEVSAEVKTKIHEEAAIEGIDPHNIPLGDKLEKNRQAVPSMVDVVFAIQEKVLGRIRNAYEYSVGVRLGEEEESNITTMLWRA